MHLMLVHFPFNGILMCYTDMPQHIIVDITNLYLPGSSLEVFYIIFHIGVCVWYKANTELATPLKYQVH